MINVKKIGRELGGIFQAIHGIRLRLKFKKRLVMILKTTFVEDVFSR